MSRTDQFAEYLAEGKTIPQIQAILGINKATAQGIMWRIRRALGGQAI
jgi:hypothetical protein